MLKPLYHEVKAKLPEIVKAAIVADMRYRGYEPNDPDDPDGGFQQTVGPKSSAGGDGATYRISGPSSGGNATCNGDHVGPDVIGFSPHHDVYQYWPKAIQEQLGPWVDHPIPDGSVFDETISHVTKAAKTLLSNGDRTFDEGHGKKTYSLDSGNPELDDIGVMEGKLTAMRGDWVLAFQRSWADHLPGVLKGQAGIAAAIAMAVGAEKALYTVAQENVATVAHEAHLAFKAAGHSSLDNKVLINIVTQGLAVAAFAAATGGAGAALTAVIQGTALAASATQSFLPNEQRGPGSGMPLGAADPHTVLSNMAKALQKITEVGERTEAAISDHLSTICSAAEGDIAHGGFGFRLGRLRGRDSTAQRQIDHPDLLKFDRTDAHQIGDILMPNIAKQFNNAAIEAQNATSSGPWRRPVQVSGATEGCYNQYLITLDFLTNLLDDTSTQIVRAGELFSAVADDIANQDSEAEARMNRARKQLEDGSGAPAAGHGTKQINVHVTPGAQLPPVTEDTPVRPTETNADRERLNHRLGGSAQAGR